MFINQDLLITFGALYKKYPKHEFIFMEGDAAKCFFQIVEGSIRMYNTNEEGKEFTQGHFGNGECFGEPPLFINEHYPATAITLTETTVLKISKENFFKLLHDYPRISYDFNVLLAQRIFNKSVTVREIVNNNPEHRIVSFLEHYKHTQNAHGYKILIPYTRQEIGNFTGLRVETVIRTMSKMQEKGLLEIRNRKVYF